ncbi:MAG: hypothetical protein KAR42_02840 [candidate division Zixibacteria bacterium]|nr:hypothetical protein [candidate division Zixibacteria bacterium]
MNNADLVLNFLNSHQDYKYCDDCLTTNSGVHPHQQINQICRIRLSQEIIREQDQCSICGRFKIVNQSIVGVVV